MAVLRTATNKHRHGFNVLFDIIQSCEMDTLYCSSAYDITVAHLANISTCSPNRSLLVLVDCNPSVVIMQAASPEAERRVIDRRG